MPALLTLIDPSTAIASLSITLAATATQQQGATHLIAHGFHGLSVPTLTHRMWLPSDVMWLELAQGKDPEDHLFPLSHL